jgi:hypothetical protein
MKSEVERLKEKIKMLQDWNQRLNQFLKIQNHLTNDSDEEISQDYLRELKNKTAQLYYSIEDQIKPIKKEIKDD